jgi:coenzyme F420-reducing hydrogenase beta subunit
MKPAVLLTVVNNDLCIGCGLCAGICPDNVLQIRYNQFGEYNPVSIGECTKQCGLCLKVCPFAKGNPDEDKIGQQLYGEVPEIQYRSETGYSLATYAGYSGIGGHREHGSSGGMATWLLETMLKIGIIDAVACITHNPDPDKLFKFAIFTKAEDVRASAGSAYYPVELSEVIRYIIDNSGRYAVVGVPCFVKAIRLAQQKNKKLRERIIVVLGLNCGQLKSKNYTAYLASLAGLKEAPIKVHFRGKDSGQTANNYFFSCTDKQGKERRIYQNEGVSEAWGNRWFTPNACNYCDDIFAECADVTFMDAWLPKYSSDPRGTNIDIVRTVRVNELLRDGIESGDINVNNIVIDEVIQSQEGLIAQKRKFLGHRLYRAHMLGLELPMKRVKSAAIVNPLTRLDIELKEEMQRVSRNNFADRIGKDDFNIQAFRQSMIPYLNKIRLIRLISRGLSVPQLGIRKIMRYIHG